MSLTPHKYRPHGGTALMDAIAETINMAEIHQPRMWADQDDNTVSVVILTDGDENSSKAYTPQHVAGLINYKRTQEWNFVFLGANQDAIMKAGDLNIPKESAMTFSNETVDTAMRSAADALNRMVSGESQTVEFSRIERAASCPS